MSIPSSRLDVATSAGQAAVLELLLDLDPLLAGDAAVVGADQLLAGQLVEPLREPLGQPPAVGEDDRAAVAPDQLEDARVDRRPDARAQVAGRSAGPPGCCSGGRTSPSAAMSSTGTMTWSSSGLRAPASTMVDLAVGADAAEEPGDRVERPLRGATGRSAAAAAVAIGPCRRAAAAERLEAFQAQGEVGAALGAGDRVDLVDDDVLDAAQDLAGRAGQHQVQRFRAS